MQGSAWLSEEELLRRGWDQGALLSARTARHTWLEWAGEAAPGGESAGPGEPNSPGWTIRKRLLDQAEVLVVTSQACDLARSPDQEPWVEVVLAAWTGDKQTLNDARNSYRQFVLRRRTRDDGAEEGLVADATVRLYLDKRSLRGVLPEQGVDPRDPIARKSFRRWLSDRYERPAVPTSLVLAVQAPVVKAVRRLRAGDERQRLLDGVDQVLFHAEGDEEPYRVSLILMRNERQDAPLQLSEDDAAELADWLAEAIRRAGKAEVVDWEILDTRAISVYDYINAHPLQLDYYTLRGEPSAVERFPFSGGV